jgi:hypothetical protein
MNIVISIDAEQSIWNAVAIRKAQMEHLIAGHEHAGVGARRQVALVNAEIARADQTRVRQCKRGFILLLLAIIIVCIDAEDKGRGILGGVLECGRNGERQMRRVRRGGGVVRADDHAERREGNEEERAETTAHLFSMATCPCTYMGMALMLEHESRSSGRWRQHHRTVPADGSGIEQVKIRNLLEI